MLKRKSNWVVLAAMLVLVACTDQSLTRLAKALDDTAKGMGALQTTVVRAQAQGVISVDTTNSILEVCKKIDLAGKQADNITRGLAQLAPADRGNILAVLKPVIAAVDDSVSTGLTGIPEPTKTKVLNILQTIQIALNTAQSILAGGA